MTAESRCRWFVVVLDRRDRIAAWCGPLPWSASFAIAALLDTRLPRGHRTRIWSRHVRLRGAPMPLPAGWRDYSPTTVNRVERTSRVLRAA